MLRGETKLENGRPKAVPGLSNKDDCRYPARLLPNEEGGAFDGVPVGVIPPNDIAFENNEEIVDEGAGLGASG